MNHSSIRTPGVSAIAAICLAMNIWLPNRTVAAETTADAGPAGVALTMRGPWVIGALANQQWSFAGWGDNDVNAMLIQPFLNYNLKKGWYLSTAPIMTANWETTSGEQWTVPIGAGFGKIHRFGKLPVNL